MQDANKTTKTQGMMLGAITGDVIGSHYEFNNTKEYEFQLFCDDSNFTDDSIMTIAVAQWLLSDPTHSYQMLEDTMVMFARRFRCPMGGYGTGFYHWLFHPDRLYPFDEKYGASPYSSSTGRHPYGSFGNGSAMRVSAVGWFFDTLEETERVAAISAAITHNHPEGIKGAHAIICFLDSKDYVDAIRKAVSLGGDSDTLACITGGIAEAFYGPLHPYLQDRVLPLLPQDLKDTLTQFSAYQKDH